MLVPAVRVFIVEDHPVMRANLITLIENESDLEVVGWAASAEDALERIAQVDPDLLMVDLSLPGMSGNRLVALLLESTPDLRALIVSGHAEHLYATESVRIGARGYVMKDDPDEIIAAVRAVLRGEIYLHRPQDR